MSKNKDVITAEEVAFYFYVNGGPEVANNPCVKETAEKMLGVAFTAQVFNQLEKIDESLILNLPAKVKYKKDPEICVVVSD